MSNQPAEDKFELQLKWPLEDGLQAVYANQFAIFGAGPEYVLLFGEFLPSGFASRSRAEVEEYLKNATVRPVAKIILSPEGLRALANLLRPRADT